MTKCNFSTWNPLKRFLLPFDLNQPSALKPSTIIEKNIHIFLLNPLLFLNTYNIFVTPNPLLVQLIVLVCFITPDIIKELKDTSIHLWKVIAHVVISTNILQDMLLFTIYQKSKACMSGIPMLDQQEFLIKKLHKGGPFQLIYIFSSIPSLT